MAGEQGKEAKPRKEPAQGGGREQGRVAARRKAREGSVVASDGPRLAVVLVTVRVQ
jgi:hypothetical protein